MKQGPVCPYCAYFEERFGRCAELEHTADWATGTFEKMRELIRHEDEEEKC